MRIRWVIAAVAVALLAAGCGSQAPTASYPTFPAGNPIAGAKIFSTTCTACHGPTAGGVPGLAPSLNGRKSLFELYPVQWQLASFIYSYMPKSNPGSLTKQQASDLAAFLYALNGKLGSTSQQNVLALLTHGKTPPPSTGVTSPSQWLSYDAAKKTVTVAVIAGYNNTQSGFNFNGYANGQMTITVPQGWTVTVNFTNKGQLPHSAAIVAAAAAKTPVFPGASTPASELAIGLAPGQSASFTFTAAKAGRYRVACLVPGHETLGMWDNFVVAASGTPSLTP
jgi:sulfocyanin